MIKFLAQTAIPAVEYGVTDRISDFVLTPAPYSPFTEYLLVMFVLWLLARHAHRKRTFESEAQEVLDRKFADGEITRKAYDKYRQDVTLRPKR
jgi:hypothetical protein